MFSKYFFLQTLILNDKFTHCSRINMLTELLPHGTVCSLSMISFARFPLYVSSLLILCDSLKYRYVLFSRFYAVLLFQTDTQENDLINILMHLLSLAKWKATFVAQSCSVYSTIQSVLVSELCSSKIQSLFPWKSQVKQKRVIYKVINDLPILTAENLFHKNCSQNLKFFFKGTISFAAFHLICRFISNLESPAPLAINRIFTGNYDPASPYKKCEPNRLESKTGLRSGT